MSFSVSVVILDCNSCSWGSLWEKWSKKGDLIKRLVASITVYANTHISSSVNSNLIIIAAGAPLQNRVIFSSETMQKNTDVSEKIDSAIRNALQANANSGDKFIHTNYAREIATGICCKSIYDCYVLLCHV